jgi:protein TonB
MPHYPGTTEPRERARALAAVVIVHAALGALLLSGLDVVTVTQAADRLSTFDITTPPPPPPPPQPQPAREPEAAAEPQGAPAPRAQAAPVVIPRPRIVIPAKRQVAAATLRGTGAAPNSGAAAAGTGTGAGGTGTGRGGGGRGGAGGGSGGGRETPALLLTKIPHRDYRAIAGQRLPQGRATLAVRVNPDGSASNCRVTRSSGDMTVDGSLCVLAERRLRFQPPLDRTGRAISQDILYTATWQPF